MRQNDRRDDRQSQEPNSTMLSNQNAECDVIGLLLKRPDDFHEINGILTSKDFENKFCADSFKAIRLLAREGKPINRAAIAHLVPNHPDEGMAQLLARVMGDSPAGILASEQAWIVKDASLRRQAKAALEQAAKDIATTPAPDEVLQGVQYNTGRLIGIRNDYSSALSTLARKIVARTNPADKSSDGGRIILKSGLPFVDKMIGTMMSEDLIVLGGATSMGKTALAQQIALAVASTGVPVDFISLEMSADQIATRFVSMLTGLSLEKLETGEGLRDEDIELIDLTERDLRKVPLNIISKEKATVADCLSMVEQSKRKRGTQLVILDHLHYLQRPYGIKDRWEAIEENVKALKAAAKRTQIPWLCLAHLNSDNIKRDNKRPVLNDLFGGSEIQKSADCVFFVHRPIYCGSNRRNQKPRMKRSTPNGGSSATRGRVRLKS